MNSNTEEDSKLLFVENNENSVISTEFQNFSIQKCNKLLDARVELDENPESYKAIVLDEKLPEGHIELFIEWLVLSFPQLPIILLTENKNNKVLARYLNLGVAGFLQSPYTQETFIDVLNNLLNNEDVSNISAEKGSIDAEFFTNDWVELSANSEIEFLARIQRFSEVLLRKHLSADIVEDIKLAMEEYGRNAIEWGNKFDLKKKFTVSYCIFEDRIILKFEDEGEGFDFTKLSNPTLDPVKHLQSREEAGKRPGGYGIYMMNNIMDEVMYNDKGNVCIMTKFLK